MGDHAIEKRVLKFKNAHHTHGMLLPFATKEMLGALTF
jgi:hypothetical protein